jgi:hypothetical protein
LQRSEYRFGNYSVQSQSQLFRAFFLGAANRMLRMAFSPPHVTHLISEWMITELASDRAAMRAFAAAHCLHPPPRGAAGRAYRRWSNRKPSSELAPEAPVIISARVFEKLHRIGVDRCINIILCLK